MSVRIGTSLLTYNCLSQDYCLEACIASVLDMTDEVAVVDAQSTDGTWEWLNDTHGKDKRVKLITMEEPKTSEPGGDLSGKNWLVRGANKGRELLTTEWHFMIQADEVMHEQDVNVLHAHAQGQENAKIGLLEFWRNHRQTNPIRVAARIGGKDIPACDDGGVLNYYTSEPWVISRARIYHYGFIRSFEKWREKSKFLQASLHGAFDQRWLGSAESVYQIKNEFVPFTGTHPKYIHKWLREHNFAP